jgi:deoxyribodipyrimidine photo-lyase
MSTKSAAAIVWLRDDLRLDDQPAIAAAADAPALFVYLFDEESTNIRPLGGASKWWLAHSLEALAASLEAKGARLDVLRGPADSVIPALAEAAGDVRVLWTRRYGGGEVATDKAVKTRLQEAQSFNGQLLREPWEVVSGSGEPFRVYTPFWRRSRALGPFDAPSSAPARLTAARWPNGAPERIKIADLGLTPRRPDWSGGLAETWRPGEQGAKARLKEFLDEILPDYVEARDRPAETGTSRLSPHLRFGEISPRRIVAAIEHAAAAGAPASACEK